MLRITDVLLCNLVWAILAQDSSHIPTSDNIPANLEELTELIRSCGATFQVNIL